MLDKLFSKIKRFVPGKWKWILEHGGFKKYFANTGWMFFGQSFILLVAFIVGIWLARYLGPQKYGALNYIISFVSLFAFLSSLGLEDVLNRELIKNPENKEKLLGTGFFLRFLGAIFLLLIISIISFLVNKDRLTNLLIILYSCAFIFQSFSVINVYFQSQVLAKRVVKIQFLATTISAILKILFILLKLDISWFIFSYLFDSIVLGFGFIYIFIKSGYSIFDWKFDKNLAKNILNDSWPLMLTTFSFTIYSRIDQVMIKNLLDNEAVGIYSVAVKLSEVWYFIPSLICASLFPAIVKSKSTSQDVYARRLKKLYILIFWLAALIALFFFVFAHFIIKTFFGLEYIGAVNVLQIYVWAGVAVALSMVVGKYLITENYVKIFFYITLAGAILNIILNMVFIPSWGIIGAAWATLFSYLFVLIFLLFFKKTRQELFIIFKLGN